MELRHLRYFVAVAEERNFSRAALKLHIAQPPLSQQIRSLEHDLGVQLLLRNSRGVELTAAGKHFLGEAQQILAQADRAKYLARRVAQGQAGCIQVACGPIASLAVLPPVLARFRQSHPQVDLQVHDMLTDPALDALLRGSVDVVFGLAPFESEGVQSEIVYRDRLTVAVPKGHALSRLSRVDLRDCAGEQFVVIARSTSTRAYEMGMELCRRAGFRPEVIHEVNGIQSQLTLISAGFGFGLVPSSVKVIGSGVTFLPLPETVPTVDLAVGWKVNDESPIVGSFLQMVRKTLGSTKARSQKSVLPTRARTPRSAGRSAAGRSALRHSRQRAS
ncbi:MAG TPA: LysR substrate-binding domain-containing protein [Terriglobales bacterium]|nr:LysR substrate-binding domain-containing protein [Terriglobales bacterium]